MSWQTVCLATIAVWLPASGAVFSGRVLEDHSGAPLPRVEIRITRPDAPGIVAETETDGQGSFQTADLPDGEYLLRAAKIDYSTVTMRARPHLTPVLRLIRFGAVAGHIRDTAGKAISSAQVLAISGTAQYPVLISNGEYRIFGLPPGRYRVAVMSAGVRRGVIFYPTNSQPREFVISGGEDYEGIDFLVPDGDLHSIGGAINAPDDGKYKGLTLVSAEYPELKFAQMPAKRDGTFLFEHVGAGNYEVLMGSMLGDGSAPAPFGRVHVTLAGQDVNVEVPSMGTRLLSFTLSNAGVCGSEATVKLTPADTWILAPAASVTLRAGKPASVNLAPGRYTLAAKAANANCYATVRASLDLTAEAPHDPVDVALSPAGSIRGHLAGAVRASDYAAVLMPEGGTAVRVEFPGEEGNFVFEDLEPGRYTVRAVRAGVGRWLPELPSAAATDVRGGTPVELEIRVSEGEAR